MNAGFLIALGWVAYLVLAVLQGGLAAWIAPWQHGVVVAGIVGFAVALVLFAVGGGWRPAGRWDWGSLPTLGINLVPLALLGSLGITHLDGAAIRAAPVVVPSASVRPTAGPQPGIVEITLTDLARTPDGQAVRLTGMWWRPSSLDLEDLPEAIPREPRPRLIHRFRVWCCAADAQSVQVLVEGWTTEFDNRSWVEAEGVLRHGPSGLAILTLTAIRSVPRPVLPLLQAPRESIPPPH